MQLIPIYLFNNRIDIITSDTRFITEYRPVYSRNILVYRGIDNKIQFRLLNADQKPVEVTKTPVLVAFDENDKKIIQYICTVTDDGSTKQTRGTFEVTILENDLLNLDSQYLSYAIYLEDSTTKELTYTARSFEASGIINIKSTAFPGPKSNILINYWYEYNEFWAAGSNDTDKITAEPEINSNNSLHTVAIYNDSYIGDVEIQATLDNQIASANNWTTIATVSLTGDETQPVPVNFNGVFSFLRFKTTEDPNTKITKILVRN